MIECLVFICLFDHREIEDSISYLFNNKVTLMFTRYLETLVLI